MYAPAIAGVLRNARYPSQDPSQGPSKCPSQGLTNGQKTSMLAFFHTSGATCFKKVQQSPDFATFCPQPKYPLGTLAVGQNS